MFAIAEALELNKTLNSLSLSMTDMGAAGVKHLSTVLKINRSLKHLDLSGNFEGLTDAGVKSLGALLGSNETVLSSLDLGSSHVSPAGIAHLAEGLFTNTIHSSLCWACPTCARPRSRRVKALRASQRCVQHWSGTRRSHRSICLK